MGERPIRILMAKPGLDSHERALKLMTNVFRDAGMEVVYLGMYQEPEQIVRAAVAEDVDVIGLSCHAGEHVTAVPEVVALANKDIPNAIILVGGSIATEDIPRLKSLGVAEVFTQGSLASAVVRYVRDAVAAKQR